MFPINSRSRQRFAILEHTTAPAFSTPRDGAKSRNGPQNLRAVGSPDGTWQGSARRFPGPLCRTNLRPWRREGEVAAMRLGSSHTIGGLPSGHSLIQGYPSDARRAWIRGLPTRAIYARGYIGRVGW